MWHFSTTIRMWGDNCGVIAPPFPFPSRWGYVAAHPQLSSVWSTPYAYHVNHSGSQAQRAAPVPAPMMYQTFAPPPPAFGALDTSRHHIPPPMPSSQHAPSPHFPVPQHYHGNNYSYTGFQLSVDSPLEHHNHAPPPSFPEQHPQVRIGETVMVGGQFVDTDEDELTNHAAKSEDEFEYGLVMSDEWVERLRLTVERREKRKSDAILAAAKEKKQLQQQKKQQRKKERRRAAKEHNRVQLGNGSEHNTPSSTFGGKLAPDRIFLDAENEYKKENGGEEGRGVVNELSSPLTTTANLPSSSSTSVLPHHPPAPRSATTSAVSNKCNSSSFTPAATSSWSVSELEVGLNARLDTLTDRLRPVVWPDMPLGTGGQ